MNQKGWLTPLSTSEVRHVVSISLLDQSRRRSGYGVNHYHSLLCKGAECYFIDIICERMHDLAAARDFLCRMLSSSFSEHPKTPRGVPAWASEELVKKTAVTLAKVLPTMAADAAMKCLAELCDSVFGETVWRWAGHAMRAASARNGFKHDEEGCYVSNCLRTISIRSWLSEGGRSKFDDGSWTFFNEAFNDDATGIPCAANAPKVPLVRTYFDAEKKHRLRADIAWRTAKSSMAEAPERALELIMRSVDKWENRPSFPSFGQPTHIDCMETSLPERQLLLLGGQILHGLGRDSESIQFVAKSLGNHYPDSEYELYWGRDDNDCTEKKPWGSDDVTSTAALLAADIYASKGNYARARNLANDVLEAIPGGTHVSEEVMESNRLRARAFLDNLADAPTDAVAVEAMPAAPVVEAMPAAPTTSPVHGVATWSSLGFKDVIAVIPSLGWCLFELPSGGEIILWDFHVNSMHHRIRGVPTSSTQFLELPGGADLPTFLLMCQINERQYGGDVACQPLKLNLLLDLPRGGLSSFEDLTGPDYTRCALSSGLPMQEAFTRLEARTTQICWNNDDLSGGAVYAIQDLKSDGWVIASTAKYGRGREYHKVIIARSSAKSVRGPFSFDARDEPGVLRFTSEVSSLVFTTPNVLASGTVFGTIIIWDCRALSCRCVSKPTLPRCHGIRRIEFQTFRY